MLLLYLLYSVSGTAVMVKLNPLFKLDEAELLFTFIRSPGPGGQNVNKVASGAQLRFNVSSSPSLPEELRNRFLKIHSSKITGEGEILIKATRFRTQERNKQDALERLLALLQEAAYRPKKRKKTKPSYTSIQNRLSKKKLHGKTKSLRGKKIGREE
jgi:ribosome-associated protein